MLTAAAMIHAHPQHSFTLTELCHSWFVNPLFAVIHKYTVIQNIFSNGVYV